MRRAILLALLLAIAGCGSAPTETVTPPAPTQTATPPAPTDTPQTTTGGFNSPTPPPEVSFESSYEIIESTECCHIYRFGANFTNEGSTGATFVVWPRIYLPGDCEPSFDLTSRSVKIMLPPGETITYPGDGDQNRWDFTMTRDLPDIAHYSLTPDDPTECEGEE